MKTIFMTAFVAASLALRAHAYIAAEDGALNVRHFHMVERSEDGDIVGRAFSNEYEIVRRDEDGLEARGRCTTVLACGTAGGCATMAGQRYCKGESWQKSFQKAVSQTGANGIQGLKMMAEGIGRGPVGTLIGAAKTTAKAIVDAKKKQKATRAKAPAKKKHSKPKKNTKKPKAKAPAKKNQKRKRDLEDVEEILNRRDFEVVERDENMEFVQRSEYSTFDIVTRNEDGELESRECEMLNGDVSCM